jgi:hypothetical protein
MSSEVSAGWWRSVFNVRAMAENGEQRFKGLRDCASQEAAEMRSQSRQSRATILTLTA